MALEPKQLTKVDNLKPATPLDGRSRQLWWYEGGADALATIAAAGYFNSVRGQMQVGDQIMVMTTAGLTVLKVATIPADTTDVTTAMSAHAGKTVRGQATTVAASDTIATGLTTVIGVVATLNDDPVAGCQFVTASVGNQAGAPAAGSFLLKTWKATASGDTALIAATTFGKKVNWVAWGG